MLLYLFWASLLLILYTYFGYPLLLLTAARLFPKPLVTGTDLPQVSILIAAYNEAPNIQAKLETCLNLDYPADRLEILIGSDASDDGMDQIVTELGHERVRLVRLPSRSGKVTVLNRLAEEAKGEILFFTDARQRLAPDCLRVMVAYFADPSVGSVSGELMLLGKESGSFGEGVGFYWKYEKALRKAESKLNSMLGATGAIYTLRRELFVPAPADTLLDDMFYPLQAVLQGKRAVFAEAAHAYDQVSATPGSEMRRKVRTLAGNFQIFAQVSPLLLPFKSPIAWQFISHKLLRVLAPYFLLLLFLVNTVLRGSFYELFLAAQIAFYCLALIGSFVQGTRLNLRLFSLPLTFCSLNLAAFLGGLSYFTAKQQVTWK